MYKMIGLSIKKAKYAKFWGCSSVGRAPALQAGGRQFEPDQLHQTIKEATRFRVVFCFMNL